MLVARPRRAAPAPARTGPAAALDPAPQLRARVHLRPAPEEPRVDGSAPRATSRGRRGSSGRGWSPAASTSAQPPTPASSGACSATDAEPFLGRPGVVLLVDRDGEADLVGAGGRPLLAGRNVKREEALPARRRARARAGRVPRGEVRRPAGPGSRGDPLGGGRAVRAAAPDEEPRTPRPERGGDPPARLRGRRALVRARAPAPQPAALANGARPGAAGARRDGPRGHGRPPGPASRPLARRGGQHGGVVQPHGGRARGEPPRGRGLQPKPGGHGAGPHRRTARLAGEPSRPEEPPGHRHRQRRHRRPLARRGRPDRDLQREGERDPGPRPGRGAGPDARGGAGCADHHAAGRGGGGRARRARGLARGADRVRAVRRGAARSPSWPRRFAGRATGPSAPWS